jgi:predicted MPP superfamily phosphohydrolase
MVSRLILTGFLSLATITAFAFDFVVKPYLQFATPTTITILWETDEICRSIVRYGEPGFHQPSANLGHSIALNDSSLMHEVVLKDLTPEADYFYQVISINAEGDSLISDISTFQTSLAEDKAIAFALFCDSQSNPETWGRITTLAYQERPHFALLGGDLVGYGFSKNDWVNEFFAPSNQFMKHYPIYSVPGNHEHDAYLYYQYMANPDPEYRYTFTYGNVRFFMIDTDRDVSPGSEQYTWLEDQLAHSRAHWNIVMHHHPPYSSEENDFGDVNYEKSTEGDLETRQLVPLYEKYGVDLVVFGHIHAYERTWPIFKERVNQEKGVIYLNLGGSGGGLENASYQRPFFTHKVKKVHHFGFITVQGPTLNFEAINESGIIFDSFSLNKPTPSAPRTIDYPNPPAPIVVTENFAFEEDMTLELRPVFESNKIYYTTDGSEPDENDALYEGPVTLSETAMVKVASFENSKKSPTVKIPVTKQAPYKGKKKVKNRGVKYDYYTVENQKGRYLGNWEILEKASLEQSGILQSFGLEGIEHRKNFWGVKYSGYFHAKTDGLYTFYGHGERQFAMKIHGKTIIEERTEEYGIEGQVLLKKGWHPIEIYFYLGESGTPGIQLLVEGPQDMKKPVSPFMLGFD